MSIKLHLMPLSWNEIKSLAFSRTWADAANEDSQGKPFWIDFFEIFGITDKRLGTFEHAVKKLLGHKAKVDGFVDPWTKPTRPAAAKRRTSLTPSASPSCLSCTSG